MSRTIARGILAAYLAAHGLVLGAAQMEPDYYVAPNGNDANPGTKAEPFATLSRARDAVRKLKAGGLTKPVTVVLRGGTYPLARTVVFAPADAGTEACPITYAACPGESPVLSGAAPITGWRRLEEAPPGLSAEARRRVWVADVPETKGGARRFYALYDAQGRLSRARSEGFKPGRLDARSGPRDELHFAAGSIRNRPNLADVEVVIRPTHPWVVNILALKSVDEQARVARTTLPGTYPLGALGWVRSDPDRSCWVENVLEGLDSPGEWVLDTAAGRCYLWPRSDEPEGILAPRLTELVLLAGDEDKQQFVRHMHFRGLTFTQGDRDTWTAADAGLQHDWEIFDKPNALVRLRGAEHCELQRCRFVHSAGGGVRLDLHCRHNRVDRCEMAHLGGTGVLLCGYGPGRRDVNGHNTITNCRIHHGGQIYWHSSAVFVWQSGANRIAHNLIHHMPYNGITISGVRPAWFRNRTSRECSRTIRWDEVGGVRPAGWLDWDEVLPFLHSRDNFVADNEIHHVVEVLDDGNAIYISGAGEGNVVRRNYVHHMLAAGGQGGIRTDDFQRGTVITHNVVYRCVYGGIVLKHDNTIENNIVADLVDARKVKLCGYILLRRGPVDQAVLRRNILYHPRGKLNFYDEGRGFKPFAYARNCRTDYNLYWCAKDADFSRQFLEAMQGQGVDRHSLAADPGFADPAKGDWCLKPDSPACKLGFEPVDLAGVGPAPD